MGRSCQSNTQDVPNDQRKRVTREEAVRSLNYTLNAEPAGAPRKRPRQ
jgi:hypothetical protein